MVNREKLTGADEWVIITGFLLVLGFVVGAGMYTIHFELTRPTAQEVVESIPAEMMPEGGRVWHSFGSVMINNGGIDYVEIIDKDGKLWEFHRPHKGSTWTRTKWPDAE
jgi:hypothetical protein